MFKDLLRETRVCHLLSQQQMANAIGCSLNAYHKWEVGVNLPSNSYIQKMTREKLLSEAALEAWKTERAKKIQKIQKEQP